MVVEFSNVIAHPLNVLEMKAESVKKILDREIGKWKGNWSKGRKIAFRKTLSTGSFKGYNKS